MCAGDACSKEGSCIQNLQDSEDILLSIQEIQTQPDCQKKCTDTDGKQNAKKNTNLSKCLSNQEIFYVDSFYKYLGD